MCGSEVLVTGGTENRALDMVDIASEFEGISVRKDICDLTKETAASLARFEKGRTQKEIELDQSITPDKVLPVDHEFAAL